MWPDNRILDLFGIEVPIIQAPMAGSAFSDRVVAVSQAGGLGSLAGALLNVEQARNELETIRRKTSRPSMQTSFVTSRRATTAREMSWRQRLDVA
jgi:nitronate monooxygenase